MTNNGNTRTVNLQRPYSFPIIPTSINIISAIGQQSNFPQCVAQRRPNCMHLSINGWQIASLVVNELQPTATPTNHPSKYPTNSPSIYPTSFPSINPSINPTIGPTQYPTMKPTIYATLNPSLDPTIHPTPIPSIKPTMNPTINPSLNPTLYPIRTDEPTENPLHLPSTIPIMTQMHDPTLEPIETLHVYVAYPSQAPINTEKPSQTQYLLSTETKYNTLNIENTQSILESSTNTQTKDVILCDESRLCNNDITCSSADCRILCNSDSSCRSMNVGGGIASSLSIECIGVSSCTEISVFGGDLLFVQIKCIGFESCKEGNFYGNNTNLLSIHCVSVNGSCSDINVYCPLNGKQCVISSDGIDSNDIHRYLDFYAIHGFNDLDITKYRAHLINDDNTSNMMHCGADYTSFCKLNASLFCECKYEYQQQIDNKIDYAQIAGFVVIVCVSLVFMMALIGFCMFFIHSIWYTKIKKNVNRNEESKKLYKMVNKREHMTISSMNRNLECIQEEDTDDTDDDDLDKTHLYPFISVSPQYI